MCQKSVIVHINHNSACARSSSAIIDMHGFPFHVRNSFSTLCKGGLISVEEIELHVSGIPGGARSLRCYQDAAIV